ncbi:glycosyltransferase [Paenibacillus sp. HN-1]|uniref:glycosyltransferase n=1 Tax=Paenibacillus TaxID=44249 RepID=UPI001CA99102|nr:MULTISPECIES: glycosyltransferase [Paenibacillus]MBY9080286.1 glycosyltransferase [Paenibacillus sp. CGMCC 1.18879]MBY9083055.1 glycosyltransferase [Paenibacillus sinensis]
MSSYRCEWRGPIQATSGLGAASRGYVRALRRHGVAVSTGIQRTGGLPKNQADSRTVLICHTQPHRVQVQKEKKRYARVILNTVWETTRTPDSWKPNLNRFDAIFVPSRQNKEALRNSGVKVPIYIVPHGVNTGEYRPDHPKMHVPGAGGRFVFVSVFGFQHRKNPEGLLRAYWEEFSERDQVLLIIKTNGYSPSENEAWIRSQINRYKQRLGISKRTAPVVVIGRHLSPGQLKGLYTLGNVFVLPTRGEGVGLPFLEAMASGTPVMATGWGGHMDFLNRSNSFLVNYKLQFPGVSMSGRHAISRRFRSLFANSGQLWAEADLRSLRLQMRTAFENPGLCRRKGLQARRDASKLSWERSGAMMKRAIEQTLQQPGHQGLKRRSPPQS